MKQLKGISPLLQIHNNVAIVGSSSNVLNKGYQPIIDACDEVIRFNRAPTRGFRKEVGRKETLRIVNHHTYANVKPDYKRFTVEGNPQFFVKNLKNKRVVIANGDTVKKYENRKIHTDPSTESFYIFPSIQNELKTLYDLPKDPSIGLIGIYIFVKNDIVPKVFGFGVGEPAQTHYWEERSPKVHCHDFNAERELIKRWHKEEKIILYL